jgi:hypothetical protein
MLAVRWARHWARPAAARAQSGGAAPPPAGGARPAPEQGAERAQAEPAGAPRSAEEAPPPPDAAAERVARRLEQRAKLRESFNKHVNAGLVRQLVEINASTELRLFPTSETLDPRAESAVLPPLLVTALSGSQLAVPRKGRVTLLLLAFNTMGFEMLPSWREPVERQFLQLASHGADARKRRARLQVVEICAQENRVFRFIQRFLLPAFKSTVDVARHDSVAAVYEDMEATKQALSISNTLLGYAFLVDAAGRVRWRACGVGEFRDSMLLIKNLSLLLDEAEDNSADQ